MNAGAAQSSMNSNDEVKEAVKAVVEELLVEKMEAVVNHLDEVINHLEEKIENSTEQVRIQMKANLQELKGFENELANQSQQQPRDLLSELTLQQGPLSCKHILLNSPSRYYWIYNSSEDLNHQFCDMTRICGSNGTGGWMRVANLDMTDPNQQCPDDFRLITSPKCTCGRATPVEGCATIVYPTNGHQYSQVCGKNKAYQYGQPEGFIAGDRWFVDGITLYTMSDRQSQHTWSFVVGRDEVNVNAYVCPCNTGRLFRYSQFCNRSRLFL